MHLEWIWDAKASRWCNNIGLDNESFRQMVVISDWNIIISYRSCILLCWIRYFTHFGIGTPDQKKKLGNSGWGLEAKYYCDNLSTYAFI